MECPTAKSLLSVNHSNFEKIANDVELVSFDVFDTILHRLAVNPTDVFLHIEEIYGVTGFAKARVAAEKRARARFRNGGGSETYIGEIYEVLGESDKFDAPALMQAELLFEARMTYANPYIASAIEKLRSSGKRVIAVSDMYLASSEIEHLLQESGVMVDHVYSSSDFRAEDIGKYNGRMFDLVSQQEGVSKSAILHIGDNPYSDVDRARASGVLALQSEHPVELLRVERPEFALIEKNVNSPSGSLVAGMIIRENLRAPNPTSQIERFGYEFGGPLVAGFVKWIEEECSRQGIEHLALLARDGYVVAEALTLLEISDIEFRVIPSSRRMSVFPRAEELGWKAIVNLLGAQGRNVTKRKILQSLSLEDKLELPDDADVTKPVHTVLAELEPRLKEQARRELDAILKLLALEREHISNGRKVAWVDVGWALTSISALNRFLGEAIPGFFIGSHRAADSQDGLLGYLFQVGEPKKVSDEIMRVPELIELIFSDTSASTAYVEELGDQLVAKTLNKSPSEIVRDVDIQDVRQGVRRFLKDIKPHYDLISSSDLRNYNQSIWSIIPSECPPALKRALSVVPHDRIGGTDEWKTIGHYWSSASSESTPRKVRNKLINLLRRSPALYNFAKFVKFRLGL